MGPRSAGFQEPLPSDYADDINELGRLFASKKRGEEEKKACKAGRGGQTHDINEAWMWMKAVSDGAGAERARFYASFTVVHQGQIIQIQAIRVFIQVWHLNETVFKGCFLFPGAFSVQ